jgi:hypothetical protein
VNNPDDEDAEAAYRKSLSRTFTDPKVIDQMVKEKRREGKIALWEDKIATHPEEAMAELTAELNSRKETPLKDPTISDKDINTLRKSARGEIASRKNENTKEQEEDRNEITRLMYGIEKPPKGMTSYQATQIAIENSVLDEKEQGRLQGRVFDMEILAAKGGKDVRQETNKSELVSKIQQNPLKYNDEFMGDEALKGNIHPSHLTSLKLWRDKVVAGKVGTNQAKKGFDALDEYHKQKVFGKGQEGLDLFNEITTNFTDFLIEEDRSAKEVNEYMASMIPTFEESKLWFSGNAEEARQRAGKIQVRVDEEAERIESIRDGVDVPPITIDPTKKPLSEEEFKATARSIQDIGERTKYVDKWLGARF